MFIILFSPFLAFFFDLLSRRNQINSKLIIFLILLLIVPVAAIWLLEYSFINKGFSFVSTTLLLTGIQLALFTIVNVRYSVKLIVAFGFALLLGLVMLSGSFLAEWGGGSRTVLKEVNHKSYKVLILEPQLYSSKRVLRVKKMALSGLLQKHVYEQDLPESTLEANCDILFSDGRKRLLFNSCTNELRFVN